MNPGEHPTLARFVARLGTMLGYLAAMIIIGLACAGFACLMYLAPPWVWICLWLMGAVAWAWWMAGED